METIILDKQKFIEKMNKTSDYDYLFAIFLFKIDSEYWSSYFMKQMSFMKSNSIVTDNYKKSCYCNGKMELNYFDTSVDNGVIAHEFGHFVFDKMLDRKEGVIITNIFKKEVASFIEDEKYLTKLHKKHYPSITWHQFCWNRKHCPVMLTDGISILKGKCSIGLNHGSDYPINHLASELFAEALEAEVMGYDIPLTIYKVECPKTYSYIRNKIYEILKP